MIHETGYFIEWFWAAAEKHIGDSHHNRFCQCITEEIIRHSENPPLARAFLLASVAIDQAMRHNPFCEYEAFARQFSFPRLESHVDWGEVGAEWVVDPYHKFDKKMDWPLGASVFCQLADDIRAWLSKSTWREAAIRTFAVQSKGLAGLFAKYDKEASDVILRSLEHGETPQPIFKMAEVFERPDLVIPLLKLIDPGNKEWDRIVNAGIQIAREHPDLVIPLLKLIDPGNKEWDRLVNVGIQIAGDKRDGLLGFELTKVVGPNTPKGLEFLGILLKIVTGREDTELAIRVLKCLSLPDFMRSPFIDFIAQIVRSGGDGLLALQLWNLSNDGDLYREEALRFAVKAATNSRNPDFVYDIVRIVGKDHPSYPDLVSQFLVAFRKRPKQSTFENLLKVLGDEHPNLYSVLNLANKCNLRLSEKHKILITQERRKVHRQKILRQGDYRLNPRHNHLAAMAQWRSVERLAYIARDRDRKLAYYPAGWADVDDVDISLLDDDTRKALVEKLRSVRKGPWRKLMARLQSTDK